MMNENNEVFTMEDEPLATVVQNMRKGRNGSPPFWKVTARRWTGSVT